MQRLYKTEMFLGQCLYVTNEYKKIIMEEIKKYKNKYIIKSARLDGWDYSQAGYYFVTICTKNREYFFGYVVGKWEEAEMQLSEIGETAVKYWLEIPLHFDNVILDEFVVMPNHVHGVIVIDYGNDGMDIAIHTRRDVACNVSTRVDCNVHVSGKNIQMSKMSPKPKSLSAIIRSFKSAVTNTINQKYPENNFAWQTRFHDRVIRNEFELNNVRNYIFNNPGKWHLDRNNSESLFM